VHVKEKPRAREGDAPPRTVCTAVHPVHLRAPRSARQFPLGPYTTPIGNRQSEIGNEEGRLAEPTLTGGERRMAERVGSKPFEVLTTKNLARFTFLRIRQNRTKAGVETRIEHAERPTREVPLPVDIPTMTDLHDHDGHRRIVDRVEDPVVTLSQTVLVPARELLRAGGPWVSTETLDPGGRAPTVLLRQRLELFRG
jgi:hypothetical protein